MTPFMVLTGFILIATSGLLMVIGTPTTHVGILLSVAGLLLAGAQLEYWVH